MITAFAALALTTAIACSSKRDTRSNGGGGVVDSGGGGDLQLHSREEAEREIRAVWQKLTDSSPDNPLYLTAAYLSNREEAARSHRQAGTPLTSDEKKLAGILHAIIGAAPAKWDKRAGKYQDTDYSRKMKNVPLRLQETGLCNGPDHIGHIASVSRLDLTGEVCVSLQEVRKMPKAGLLPTSLLALLAHEIAHLHGYGESDARLLQTYLLKKMPAILGLRGDAEKIRFALKAEQIIRLWKKTAVWEMNRDRILQLKSYSGQLFQLAQTLPRPGENIHLQLPYPQRYQPLLTLIDNISTAYAKKADELLTQLGNQNSLRTDAHYRRFAREGGIRSALLYKEILSYLFADEIPLPIARHELDEPGPLEIWDVLSVADDDPFTLRSRYAKMDQAELLRHLQFDTRDLPSANSAAEGAK